jgi:NAD+ kinase
VAITVADAGHDGVLGCDGRRTTAVPAGARVQVRRGDHPVLIARTHGLPFTERLVAKFGLPVEGFRTARR